jgi:hypothetical protein
MKNTDSIDELKLEIAKSQEVLDSLKHYFKENYKTETFIKKELKDAVFLAEVYVNYYTAAETIFLRVSQFFENNLEKSSWHRSLLNKMRLEVPGVRKALLRLETYDLADELLRFRHFKRYYFEFRYDWDRIEFLGKEFQKFSKFLEEDICSFLAFLDKLKSND